MSKDLAYLSDGTTVYLPSTVMCRPGDTLWIEAEPGRYVVVRVNDLIGLLDDRIEGTQP